jgi:hypothetical protein
MAQAERPPPPFEGDLTNACRLYEILLFALASAWQRRAIDVLSNGSAVLAADVPTPFPVKQDGTLLLRGGLTGWLLDEFARRYCVSPLSQSLGVLSLALEGAVHADGGGEGRGASPDMLRLGCDALAQSLMAVQAEEAMVAAATIESLRETMPTRPRASAAEERAGLSGSPLAIGNGSERASSRVSRRSRRAAVALGSASKSIRASSRAGARTAMRLSMRLGSSLSSITEGDGGASGESDDDEEEGGAVSIDRLELRTYTRCLATLTKCVSARLPRLIAERDEAETFERDEADGGEEATCAELLVHLLSLSHRLVATEARQSSRHRNSRRHHVDSGGGSGPSVPGSRGVGSPPSPKAEIEHRYSWQEQLCPPALASAACAVLRSAAALLCEQELRAATQTRRASYGMGGGGGLGGAVASGGGGLWGVGRRQAAPSLNLARQAWVQTMRLRRLRGRLACALPSHVALLSTIAGGSLAVFRVWVETISHMVIDPIEALCAEAPVGGPTTVEVLRLCLEHRRTLIVLTRVRGAILLSDAQRRAQEALQAVEEATAGGGVAPAVQPEADPAYTDEGGHGSSADEELVTISDLGWYSPFIFDWLATTGTDIERWLRATLCAEDWTPVGAGRHSRTLTLLFAAGHTLVRTLCRLAVLSRGEAVTAAQLIADHFLIFADSLEHASADADANGKLRQREMNGDDDGKGREVERMLAVSKVAGAAAGIVLGNAHRSLLGDVDVVISNVERSSVLHGLVRVGERLVSIDGVPVGDAMAAAATLKAASNPKLHLAAPAGVDLERDGGRPWAVLSQLREERARTMLQSARELLALLRVEETTPVDDPLDKAEGGGSEGGGAEGEGMVNESSDDLTASAVSATRLLALEDGALRTALGYGAEDAAGEEESIFATLLEDEGGGTSPFLFDGTTVHELRRQCLLTSNAAAARRHLEELASLLETSIEEAGKADVLVAGASPANVEGVLMVRLKRAVGLKAADINGKSDPYAVLCAGGQERTSRVVHRSLSPEWNESFELRGKLGAFMQTGLLLKLFDKDRLTKDDPLGEVTVELSDLHTRVSKECEAALPTQGMVFASVSWLADAPDSLNEQRAIISEVFVDVFARLRKASDEQLSSLLRRVVSPLVRHLNQTSPMVAGCAKAALGCCTARGGAGVATNSGGDRGGGDDRALARLTRSYARGFSWLRRYLGVDVLQRLLQRVWTEGIAAITRALGQHLFVPRAIGDAFAAGALAVIDELAPVLHCEGDGPSKEWVRRRAAPLRATLELAGISTGALIQQQRIQPKGPKGTAPLVALAMRMDDPAAATLVTGSEFTELCVDDVASLDVDGKPALEQASRAGTVRLYHEAGED